LSAPAILSLGASGLFSWHFVRGGRRLPLLVLALSLPQPKLSTDRSLELLLLAQAVLLLPGLVPAIPRDAQREAHLSEVPLQALQRSPIYLAGKQQCLCLVKTAEHEGRSQSQA